MVSTRFVSVHACLAALFVAACSSTIDPCPRGSVMDERAGQCVSTENPGTAGDGGVDASVSPEKPVGDAGQEFPPHDGSVPPVPDPRMDAGTDAQVEGPVPDAAIEAGTSAPDGGDDAGEGDTLEPDAGMLCESDDIANWQAFHTQDGMVQRILACAANPTCGGVSCEFDACLRDTADVHSCDGCVADEASCMFSAEKRRELQPP